MLQLEKLSTQLSPIGIVLSLSMPQTHPLLLHIKSKHPLLPSLASSNAKLSTEPSNDRPSALSTSMKNTSFNNTLPGPKTPALPLPRLTPSPHAMSPSIAHTHQTKPSTPTQSSGRATTPVLLSRPPYIMPGTPSVSITMSISLPIHKSATMIPTPPPP